MKWRHPNHLWTHSVFGTEFRWYHHTYSNTSIQPSHDRDVNDTYTGELISMETSLLRHQRWRIGSFQESPKEGLQWRHLAAILEARWRRGVVCQMCETPYWSSLAWFPCASASLSSKHGRLWRHVSLYRWQHYSYLQLKIFLQSSLKFLFMKE